MQYNISYFIGYNELIFIYLSGVIFASSSISILFLCSIEHAEEKNKQKHRTKLLSHIARCFVHIQQNEKNIYVYFIEYDYYIYLLSNA